MYTVGISRGTIEDETRRNWANDGPRPVAWVAWYPADDKAQGEVLSIPASATDSVFILTGGVLDAAVNSSRVTWPVVLLSHGTGGSAFGMDWLGARLAAHGFIAIAVSHHGNTALEPYLPEGFICWWERASDLSFALDVLSQGKMFSHYIDFSRVFAVGFSLGSYTALAMAGAITQMQLFDDWLETIPHKGPNGPKEFPDLSEHFQKLITGSAEFRASQDRHHQNYLDTRIKAVLALAPPPPVRAFTPQSLSAIDIPVSIIVGPADTEAPPEPCAKWLDAHLPNSHLTLLDKEVGHYVFLNEATEFGKTTEPDICIDANGVIRSEIHHQTLLAALTLFEKEF